MTLPERHRLVVERDRRLGAADRDGRVRVEPHREVAERDLQRRRGHRVADEQVGGAEGEVVHRPCREEALRAHALPARVVLDRGLDAAFEDLECRAHGTGVAAAASSRRTDAPPPPRAIVGSQSRNAPTSKGLSSIS